MSTSRIIDNLTRSPRRCQRNFPSVLAAVEKRHIRNPFGGCAGPHRPDLAAGALERLMGPNLDQRTPRSSGHPTAARIPSWGMIEQGRQCSREANRRDQILHPV